MFEMLIFGVAICLGCTVQYYGLVFTTFTFEIFRKFMFNTDIGLCQLCGKCILQYYSPISIVYELYILTSDDMMFIDVSQGCGVCEPPMLSLSISIRMHVDRVFTAILGREMRIEIKFNCISFYFSATQNNFTSVLDIRYRVVVHVFTLCIRVRYNFLYLGHREMDGQTNKPR